MRQRIHWRGSAYAVPWKVEGEGLLEVVDRPAAKRVFDHLPRGFESLDQLGRILLHQILRPPRDDAVGSRGGLCAEGALEPVNSPGADMARDLAR